MNVVLVTNLAPPYRRPVWDDLARRVDRFTVLLCGQGQQNRSWTTTGLEDYAFDVEVLPGWSTHVRRMDWGIYVNPTILARLRDLRPSHVMVEGYEAPSYVATIAYAAWTRTPLVMWWKSHAMSSRHRSGPIAWARRRLLSASDAYLASGTPARRYLLAMGMPEQRIARSPNTIDVDRLVHALDDVAPDPTADHRVAFLYVGQFLERKGVAELLQAFAGIDPAAARLTLVGYGPEEPRLRALASTLELEHVTFAGATRTMEETARFLATADVLAMPSKTEVWGLVVNEALVAGLYVLVSDRAGCAEDLVDGAPVDVGATFDPYRVDDLRSNLQRAIERVRAGTVNRRAIQQWGRSLRPERLAEAAHASLQMASKAR